MMKNMASAAPTKQQVPSYQNTVAKQQNMSTQPIGHAPQPISAPPPAYVPAPR